MLVVDDDCVCVEASLGACRLLGLGRSELVGSQLDQLLRSESGDWFGHIWQAFRDAGGHAEPFSLGAAPSAPEVGVTVTANILPSRHLVRIDPVAEDVEDTPPAGLEPTDLPPQSEPGIGRAPTAREQQVLGLLADGATDGQIATMLALSPATVQTHVRNAKAKLGARTRAQAVALAIRSGLIAADAPDSESAPE